MEKKPSFFIFSKLLKPHIRAQLDTKRGYIYQFASFLFKIQCFYRDKNYLDHDDQHYIRQKRNNLCLATILKKDNSSCL